MGGLSARPEGATWLQVLGVAMLGGIGFTMSLFIGALAFPDAERHVEAAKLGILAGSLVSAMAGFLVLRFASPTKSTRQDIGEADELFGADQNE
jgi:NhaA family Na+:H+ antiporter